MFSVIKLAFYLSINQYVILIFKNLKQMFHFLQVKPSDASLLKVSTHTKAHGTIQYKIKILKQLPLDEQIFVHVISPSTMQDIQVSN